jgi:hypothetical protein
METSNHTLLPPGHHELPSIADEVVQQISFNYWVEQYDYSMCASSNECVQIVVVYHGLNRGIVSPGSYEFFYKDTLEASYFSPYVTWTDIEWEDIWDCRSYQVGNCEDSGRASPTSCTLDDVLAYYPEGGDGFADPYFGQ